MRPKDAADGASPGRGRWSWKPPVFGAAGGLMLVIMGNLVGVLWFMSAYGIGGKSFFEWFDVSGMTSNEPRHSWYPSQFFAFFNASRVYRLDATDGRVITEFPMFSFLLGDLHPHVMALPFVLLAAAVGFTLFRSDEPLDIAFWLQRPLALVASAIVVGGLAFLNTWDIATFAFVVVAAASISNFRRVRRLTLDLGVQVVTFALPLLLLAVLLYLPFYSSFTSQANGIGAVVERSGIAAPATRPTHLLLFWGPLFARHAAVRLRAPARDARARDAPADRGRLRAGGARRAGLGAAVLVPVGHGQRQASRRAQSLGADRRPRQRLDHRAVPRGDARRVVAHALARVDGRADRDEREGVVYALGLISTALLLILGTEFFYVGDVFNSRMNTVFKLYYQAWLLLAVGGGFSLYYIATKWRFTFPRAVEYRRVWAGGVAIVLVGAALYPLAGVFNRTAPYNAQGHLIDPAGELAGLSYLPTDELKAIAFLRDRDQGQDLVIAEAVGNDYTINGRISMATGAPAILGWGGHEDQWRGGTTKARAGRFEDVNELYTTKDMNRLNQLLKKYNVDYVVFGDVERQAYGTPGFVEAKAMPVAFQSEPLRYIEHPQFYQVRSDPLHEHSRTEHPLRHNWRSPQGLRLERGHEGAIGDDRHALLGGGGLRLHRRFGGGAAVLQAGRPRLPPRREPARLLQLRLHEGPAGLLHLRRPTDSYKHVPFMHGPFQFIGNGTVMAIFGDGDYQGADARRQHRAPASCCCRSCSASNSAAPARCSRPASSPSRRR